ncbi:hypothetical protein IFM89_016123 [Coptis chinensis]|uniref:peptidylprolyl isomerase n=1 Tax=Coptis chinensis TaxID=261450 RepID=A0A835LDT8_9MAGN|nr:hypothetical protein IFM89_016123 [Coptis chinensis]
MELLSSSTTTTLFSFKPCTPFPSRRLSFLSTSSLHISNPFLSLTSSSRQFISHRKSSTPSHLTVSASSSSVAVNTEKVDKLPADIEVTETKEPSSRVRLNVIVPPAVCEDCYKRVLAEFTKQAKVPGFRPGKKVPESILINFVGKQHVRRATIESILKRTLPHAMSSVEGRALKDSVHITTKFSDIDETFSSPEDFLRYDVLVDVEPEVKWTPENGYKNLKITVEIDSAITAEIACEAEIKRRHKALGSLRIVTDRGLQIGDVAVLDVYTTSVEKDESDTENIPPTESKDFQLDTEEAGNLPPGFLDSIVGIQPGETKSFPLVFPESRKQENLRGAGAQFTVKCKELFYRDLPALDDSLAEKILPGCGALSQLRESVLQRCQEVEHTATDQATDNAILDQLCKMIEVDIPQSLFEEQGRQLYGAKLLQIQADMKLTEEQLASLSSPRAVNEFLESQRENITNVIKQNLAVADIFKRENLQCSTEEIVKEVEDSIAEFKRNKQEYEEERIRDQVQEILEGAKVLEWLREHSDIQYVR